MKYSKQPIDHIRQIEILKERGLLIQNEEKALHQLQIISYFRLANYRRPMEEGKTIHLFKPNSYFDKKLRALVFTAIQSIEIALRTKMIHHISMKNGAFWYMDDTICIDKRMFKDNLNRIQQEVKALRNDFAEPSLSCIAFWGRANGYFISPPV